jgi:hypothetical protein
MKVHAIIKYTFAILWIAIGPNLVWQMWRGGLNLLQPMNLAFVALAAIGTITSIMGPVSRLISAFSGIILGCLMIYISWPIWISEFDEQATLSTKFWGVEFINRSAQILALSQMIILLVFSFLAAYLAADTLDRKKHSHPQK